MTEDKLEFPELWTLYPEVWPTKAKFFSWLRGALRLAVWSKYPPKLIFKNSQCGKPPEGYTGKAKSGTFCALTNEWTGKSKLEVDHIVGEVSLRGWEDVLPFLLHLLTTEDNMQLVSKDAHKVKSYAERYKMSFEDALVEKEVIAFSKLSVASQKDMLQSLGILCSKENASKRKELYRSHLKNVE